MLTKDDLIKAFTDSIEKYPTLKAYAKVQDPRLMQNIEAMATMLSMLSSQVETAQLEGFQKTRDSTILADAFMRGIVRKGRPARAKILVENTGESNYVVETGRMLLDTDGRLWQIVTPATVEPAKTAFIEAVQQVLESFEHTIQDSYPFYEISIPESEDGSYLCGIGVKDSDNNDFEYRDRYVNVLPNEKIFHVEADERQNVYVRLGYRDIVGYQPSNGEILAINVFRTFGDIVIEKGSPFSFEYTQTPLDSLVNFSMDSLLIEGQNPVPMATLRDLARYPSIYDHNAVFLGEFDFLVRRNFPTLQFLSVWNECLEEEARGANVKNINCLFVACLSNAGTEKIITAKNGTTVEIAESELTETQKSIRETIERADDSYLVRFFAPVLVPISITVKARVSTAYVASEIKEKIIEALLDEYGKTSTAAKRGNNKVLYIKVYDLLKKKIPALSEGESDISIQISGYDEAIKFPEQWRFVDEDSLTVSVTSANIISPGWS